MSTVIQIADAVVSMLNAAALSVPFTAVRTYVPTFELPEMETLRVTVAPRSLIVSRNNRSLNTYDTKIDVAVQRKFDVGDAAEIDPLMALVEEIADVLRLQRLPDYTAAHWFETEHPILYSQEHWDELRQFTSLITFSFREIR